MHRTFNYCTKYHRKAPNNPQTFVRKELSLASSKLHQLIMRLCLFQALRRVRARRVLARDGGAASTETSVASKLSPSPVAIFPATFIPPIVPVTTPVF